MNQANRIPALLSSVIVTLFAVTGDAEAGSYSFILDDFQAGPVADDFNDGTLDPIWDVFDPSVTESAGTLTFSNPGTTVGPFIPAAGAGPFPNVGQSIISEMSYIGSPFDPLGGSGSLEGTSQWTSVLPGPNQFYTMGIGLEGTDEDIAISVSNLDAQLGIGFGRFRNILTGDYDFQSIAISTGDVTGSIWLRLAYDNSTDSFTGSYSLDSGNTFLNPFASIAPTAGGVNPYWYLGGESWSVVPIPAAIWLFGSAVVALGGMVHTRRNSR